MTKSDSGLEKSRKQKAAESLLKLDPATRREIVLQEAVKRGHLVLKSPQQSAKMRQATQSLDSAE